LKFGDAVIAAAAMRVRGVPVKARFPDLPKRRARALPLTI